MPAFKRDSASRLRDAERCMKGGEPLTMREASFISSLMGHADQCGVAPSTALNCASPLTGKAAKWASTGRTLWQQSAVHV